MNFIKFSIWGAYLISMGIYLEGHGLEKVFWFYTVQGVASIFIPTIGLSNSIAFNILEQNAMSTVKDVPPIRFLVRLDSLPLNYSLISFQLEELLSRITKMLQSRKTQLLMP